MKLPVITHQGEELPWAGLQFHSSLANTDEDIARNIDSALALGLSGYMQFVGKKEGPVHVVGAGPSLKRNWKRIREMGGDIVACNAACQFLLERGVTPEYMFCFDADPLMLEFITPHPEITYLMASRCPPKAFELLKNCNVVLWHAAGDVRVQELLEKHGSMEPMISGGSAAVTRAMMLVVPMGYGPVHLWGADSSFESGDTHIRKSTTDERTITVGLNGRVFETAPWMCVQANDFKVLSQQLRDMGVKLIVHGDGLIPHLAKAMFFDVDSEGWLERLRREFWIKSRILWANL